MEELARTSDGDSPVFARGVCKSFGATVALRGVDVTVRRGEVVALLGPNGAGKSTLMRILATAVIADSGVVRVGGADVVAEPRSARASLGIVLADDRCFYWRLSGRANLEFFASLHGMRRKQASPVVADVLDAVGLAEAGDRRVDRYSTGMRARLGLARALLGSPRVLLLDEPTRSVDPIGSIELRELVASTARQRGVGVLLATHDLHEAAAVADRTLVLVGGEVARVLDSGYDAASLEAVLVAAHGRSTAPAQGLPRSPNDAVRG